jgi:hypothetical protein
MQNRIWVAFLFLVLFMTAFKSTRFPAEPVSVPPAVSV